MRRRNFPGEVSLPCFSCKRETELGSACLGSHYFQNVLRLMAQNQCHTGRSRGCLSHLGQFLSSGSLLKCHTSAKLACRPHLLPGSCLTPLDYCPSQYLCYSAIFLVNLCHLLPQHLLHINAHPIRQDLAVFLALVHSAPGTVPIT